MKGMSSKGILKEGLKTRSPDAPKEKVKGASVNSEPTRKGPAPTPKSLGPRH